MEQPRSDSEAPGISPLEKALYAVARREIDAGEMKPDAWEIAQRLSGGSDQRAKAAYIRLRVRVLLDAHHTRQHGGGL